MGCSGVIPSRTTGVGIGGRACERFGCLRKVFCLEEDWSFAKGFAFLAGEEFGRSDLTSNGLGWSMCERESSWVRGLAYRYLAGCTIHIHTDLNILITLH